MDDREEAQLGALAFHRAARASLAEDDTEEALRLLQRALRLFKHAGAATGQATVLSIIADVHDSRGEHERALEVWSQLFPLLDVTGDVNERASTLDKMAVVSTKLDRWPQALELWRQALAIDRRCGTARDQSATLKDIEIAEAKLRVRPSHGRDVRSRTGLVSHEGPFSLSERTLPPGSAPLFRVGELLATLHLGGSRCRNLQPGHLQIMPDAAAAIVRDADIERDQPLDPVRLAADFSAPFTTYPREDFRSILAGYARAGYERIDPHQPGFTDAVLDELGASVERPRPRPAVLDIPRLLVGLGLELTVEPGVPLSLGLAWLSHRPWPARLESAADSGLLLLCCLVLGVACEPVLDDAAELFGANLGRAFRELFSVAQGRANPDTALLAQLPPELDLAQQFALRLAPRARDVLEARPLAFEDLLPLLVDTLSARPLDQAGKLGDALVDVALHAAAAMTQQSAAIPTSISLAQKAVTILRYQTDGSAKDEARLAALTRGLYQLPWYRAAQANASPDTALDLDLASSLLAMYRSLVEAAVRSLRGNPSTETLWSPAYRGVELARATTRRLDAMLSDSNTDSAVLGSRALPTIVTSYALLLDGFSFLACQEHTQAGTSAWQRFFVEKDGRPSHLQLERRWLNELTTALERDPSVTAAASHLRRGTRFFGQPS